MSTYRLTARGELVARVGINLLCYGSMAAFGVLTACLLTAWLSS